MDWGKRRADERCAVFRLDDPSPTLPLVQQQTILIFAREQATDHDGSWVAFGALAQLLRDDETARKLRENTSWLVVPITDPDGAAASIWKGLQGEFFPKWNTDGALKSRPEAVLLARYFVERANAGRSLDLILGFYMLEGNDSAQHLKSVFAPNWSNDAIVYFNAKWFPLLQEQRYITGPTKPTFNGADNGRLGGWLAEHLHAYHAVYQVNARVPNDHLALNDLMFLGEMAAQAAGSYAWNEGIETHDLAAAFNAKRLEKPARALREGRAQIAPRFATRFVDGNLFALAQRVGAIGKDVGRPIEKPREPKFARL